MGLIGLSAIDEADAELDALEKKGKEAKTEVQRNEVRYAIEKK